MQDTIPRAPTEAQAARAAVSLRETPPGVPCQAKPAVTTWTVTSTPTRPASCPGAYMAAVVGELVVIDRAVIVADGAR